MNLLLQNWLTWLKNKGVLTISILEKLDGGHLFSYLLVNFPNKATFSLCRFYPGEDKPVYRDKPGNCSKIDHGV